LVRRLLLTAVFAIGAAAIFPAAALAFPQANDSFSAAVVIEGTFGSRGGANFKATKEAGEPAHAGNAGGASLWYRWVAPENGEFAFTALDLSGLPSELAFDPLLAVYTGTSVDALTEIASNDDAIGFNSRVLFNAVAGTEYRVAVDGYAGDTGRFRLGWVKPPANDDFADAVVIDGRGGTTTGSNRGATEEEGERVHAGCGEASVWYRWTAPETEDVRFDTRGSNFDTTLAVYTGTAVDALSVVAENDDFGSLDSDLSFEATAGSTYAISVAGCGGSIGNFTLHWFHGAIILGTRNDDELVGTSGRDYIAAGRGNDVVRGLGGADFLAGNLGRDRLYGGGGNDRLNSRDGQRGNDVIFGGAGQDTASADRGDEIHGVP
jgi:Ca2+-binding RTX toxin-like protein